MLQDFIITSYILSYLISRMIIRCFAHFTWWGSEFFQEQIVSLRALHRPGTYGMSQVTRTAVVNGTISQKSHDLRPNNYLLVVMTTWVNRPLCHANQPIKTGLALLFRLWKMYRVVRKILRVIHKLQPKIWNIQNKIRGWVFVEVALYSREV